MEKAVSDRIVADANWNALVGMTALEQIVRRHWRMSGLWDSLWAGCAPGRIAVRVVPSEERLKRVRERVTFDLDETAPKPARYTEKWREALVEQLHAIVAMLELPNDGFPALGVPRFVHMQSQGIADLYGARVEQQPDGNCLVHPLSPDPTSVARVEARPLDASVYWQAVEWVRYARAATRGMLPFRNPVMTSFLDTVNYLLGSTVTFQWVYSEPETIRGLLDKVYHVNVAMMRALRQAAGGQLHADTFGCMRGGPALCSEVRSVVSLPVYEAFEAPWLRRFGEALGSYGAHSCGNWERTVPSILSDSNFRAMHGQIRENDLAALCRLMGGRRALAIGPSVNLHERFTWPRTEDYLRHLLHTVPRGQPLEIMISENDLDLYERLHREILCRPSGIGEPI
ncbi:MAG: hypothetical protein M1457_04920 [bacterium]|nr:hypothetical protein [bacterium]